MGMNATQGGANVIEVLRAARKSDLLPAIGWIGIGFALVWATLVAVDLLLMVLS